MPDHYFETMNCERNQLFADNCAGQNKNRFVMAVPGISSHQHFRSADDMPLGNIDTKPLIMLQ